MNRPVRILIVDDEPPARERLAAMLADDDAWEVAGEAGNGREALDQCEALQPDVVLLDIRMPGMDGIEAARHLATLPDGPAVIFTTAYDDYAMQAFDAQAIGYLLKPVRRERLARSLDTAARLSAPQLDALAAGTAPAMPRAHVCARKGSSLKLIPVNEVYWFEADQKYVTVHHAGGEDLIDDSLKQLAEEFGDRFVRIHRRTLVALAALSRLERTESGLEVRLKHDAGIALAVSRRHAAELRRRLTGTIAGAD